MANFPESCLGGCSWNLRKPDGIDHALGCPTVQARAYRALSGQQPRIVPAADDEKPRRRFVAVKRAVMLGDLCVGKMLSKTLAKRTANALNKHVPNREGV